MSASVPFNQRFGDPRARPIDKDVPQTARIALINILHRLVQHQLVASWETLESEALYVGRRLPEEFSRTPSKAICTSIVLELSWDWFYIFCERVYRQLQQYEYRDSDGDWVLARSLADAQEYYTREINELLGEENLAYEFAEGRFNRRGRPQTEKNVRRVTSVLADPRYAPVRSYYQKALRFYNERPSADVQNCIKEAVCALEAFAEVLLGKKAAKEFDQAIRARQGNSGDQIPPAIAESIIKLRAFRGNAQGVAHATLEGYPATEEEAELCLSLVATYITYLHDKYPPKEEDLPF